MKLPMLCMFLAGIGHLPRADAACYTAYVRDGIVYQSNSTPVDLSLPLHQTVPRRFGSGSMLVITTDNAGCLELRGPPVLGDVGSAGVRGTGPRQRAADTRDESVRAAGVDAYFTRQATPMGSSIGASATDAETGLSTAPDATPATTGRRRPGAAR